MASVRNDLKQIWTDLLSDISTDSVISSEIGGKWWIAITDKYSEPQRYYHTLSHIEEMVELFMTHKCKLRQPNLVLLAIVFHDVIYDPKAVDNEEQSTFYFREFAKDMNFDEHSITTVCDWIELTKAHQTEAHTTPDIFGSGDHHFLLDFDMAVLGRSAEKYGEYAKQIRQEYSHIPHYAFCRDRANVLESFLEVPNIYATKEFRQLLEEKARLNIQLEIELLRAKVAD